MTEALSILDRVFRFLNSEIEFRRVSHEKKNISPLNFCKRNRVPVEYYLLVLWQRSHALRVRIRFGIV